MKNREDIIRKREKKKSDLAKTEKFKFEVKIRELRKDSEIECEKKITKIHRKTQSYLNRKYQEYDRKCKNEIRKLEWKPERVYKKKKKKLNLVEFAMQIMQENAKLRDTDRSWNWICISCCKLKTRKELAWGHRYSRRIKNICLCTLNINAQCHWCNFTTWPRWDKIASDRVNAMYDENLDRKWWKWTAELLSKMKSDYCKIWYDGYWIIGDETTYWTKEDLEKYIEQLIDDNEIRWKGKDFYSPSKKRRKIREEYKQN